MSTDQPYVPHESALRLAYLRERTTGTAHTMEDARAEFDRFLARVRRDAARSALTALVDDYLFHGTKTFPASVIASQIAYYCDTHYPEGETP